MVTMYYLYHRDMYIGKRVYFRAVITSFYILRALWLICVCIHTNPYIRSIYSYIVTCS